MILSLVASLLSFHVQAHAIEKPPFDFPPDTSSAQLEHALRHMTPRGHGLDTWQTLGRTADPLDEAVAVGLRNNQWLALINRDRPAGQKLSFTSKATTHGYPIDKPTIYSAKIVIQKLAKVKGTMPDAMKAVLFDGGKLTSTLPIEQDEFLSQGRSIDGIYQTALRWRMNQDYLDYLARARAKDISGYYYFGLMDAKAVQTKLATPATWSDTEKTDFSAWLTSLCLNNGSDLSSCRDAIKQAVAANRDLNAKYTDWLPKAKARWFANFRIPEGAARSDINYDQGEVFQVEFLDPSDSAVRAYLKDNIEDEWQFAGWHLRMNFTADAATHVVFEAGATPHVNGVGGDEITMNADQSLDEYDAQWSIRHEYGHTLGFVDCYVEYYDEEKNEIVSYQLDIENLMCSRQGHIQKQHVDELKRVYSPSNAAL